VQAGSSSATTAPAKSHPFIGLGIAASRHRDHHSDLERHRPGGVSERLIQAAFVTVTDVIVWLNGAFGVGKTAVARELVDLLPDARLSDPERMGYVIQRTFWRECDYQDVGLWRRLTRRQVARAGRRGTAVVPMTVARRDIFDEVTQGARVFLLTASRTGLEERIAGSTEAREWRLRNVDRCLDAFEHGGFGEPIATDDRTPTEVALLIAAQL